MRSPTSELATFLLADSRLPTGGHTQSGGLEPALLAGLAESDIAGYALTRLRTASLVDAGTAVVAWHAFAAGRPVRPTLDAWSARTPSEVLRAASYEVGRGYLRLLDRLRGGRSEHVPRPIALAALAQHLGVAPTALARLVCHDDLQSIGAAALKLAPLDPLVPVTWALALAPEVNSVVRRVADLTEPEAIPAHSAPAAELWQHAHRNTPRRLFRA